MTRDEAIDLWIKTLDTPDVAIPTVKRRFNQLRMSTEEILKDLEAKQAIINRSRIR